MHRFPRALLGRVILKDAVELQEAYVAMRGVEKRMIGMARIPKEDALRHVLRLTRREVEVLRWVARGKTNAQIGASLGLSPRTVGKHLERIYRKLGVRCRTAAVMRALATEPEPPPLPPKSRHPRTPLPDPVGAEG